MIRIVCVARARRQLRHSLLALGAVALAVTAVACTSGGSSTSSVAGQAGGGGGGSASGTVGGSLTVWVDAVRLPVAKAYAKAHPNVHLNIVTFDGDGNGATTLQTKIQLWNRTGSGWPDVLFSEQANDPIWMAQKPFDFAEPVTGLIPASLLSQWPAPSTAQCTVNGTQYCVQDNLAQVVLWYNKKLMDQFGYQVPTTWQQWAALGQKVAKEHPGYVIGNVGDSFSHWIYLWGNRCPLQQVQGSQVTINPSDSHCTEMASLLDPLIKNGTVPPLSVFSPDFAKKYGGTDTKVLMMPGPSWYGHDMFLATLHTPPGQITTAMPLQWGSDPLTTGQVGGGPWIMCRHSKNLATAADFVKWATTVFNPTGADARPGYPAYAPMASVWVSRLATNPFYAADPSAALTAAASLIWQGWNLVTYPDQPVWANTVVTGLVAGKSLSSLLQPFGSALGQAAQAAGYQAGQ
ncbi:MAG TPA: extracellular solute-binding protein [Streptosporangiaceae bacterium]|nr:extracellular solute-binding protein [Streptosporangiaceae bacterium]